MIDGSDAAETLIAEGLARRGHEMLWKIFGSCLAVLLLCGCAKTVMKLQGFDGSTVDPVLQQQYATECNGRAVTAGSGVPYSGSVIVRSLEQDQVQMAAFEGCMAEKGVRVTWEKA